MSKPETEVTPYQAGYGWHEFEAYQRIVDDLRRRRLQLGLSQEDLCAAIGLAEGHISKLEASHRVARIPTLKLWAEGLGLELGFRATAIPKATQRAIEDRQAKPYDKAKAQFKKDR